MTLVRLATALVAVASSPLVLAASPAPAAKGTPLPRAVEAVSAASAYETVAKLSSPEFAGRRTGAPGFMAAARWAAARLREAGLAAPADAPDYLERFPVEFSTPTAERMELLPADGGAPRELKPFKDYLALLYSGTADVTAEVVFVGFGITAPEMGRDDYAGVDVSGKIVMALRGAPADGRDWSAHDSHRARTAAAKAHGAAGYLFAESAVANPNGAAVEGLAMAAVSEEIAGDVLSSSKLKLDELRRVLAKGGTASFAAGRRVHLAVTGGAPVKGEAANVVALLRGSDPALAGEYVLVGAHLDHCGDWPELLPGADDNASGSATVLEIARAAARLAPRPRRTIAFVLFAGEESGLLGSKQFAARPPRGLGRCVGVYNLDMVGAGNGAYVAGGENFPELLRRLVEARDRQGSPLELKSGRSSGEPRADHGPFQAAGIPAVSLFGMGGAHHGYHTNEDTIFFITPKTMEAIGRVALEAAANLADAPPAAR